MAGLARARHLRRLRLGVAVVVALALLLPACTPDRSQTPAEPRLVSVTADEFSFAPSHVDLEAGRPVIVRLHNVGNLEHDWLLQEGGEEIAREVLDPGERAEAHFTLEPGRYHVSCTFEGHWELGMRGTVTVR